MLVGFGQVEDAKAVGAGVLITVCSDRPGGFQDEEVEAIDRLKYMLAVAVRSAFQAEIAQTLARTYLGRSAGQKVLSGQITRGGGEVIQAIIWYCDLRDSTGLCERMGMERYIPFLNDYFTAAAGPVAEAGGDILDFIGDAVLAVFPFDNGGISQALQGTHNALCQLRRFQLENCADIGRCAKLADLAGIAIDTGQVVYGNIGTEDRLTFSVIGPTVNRVARIERLTKVLHEPVLATRPIAEAAPGGWLSRGSFHLDGVTEPQELFALADGEKAQVLQATSASA
jgi:adenylate cyclase